MEDIGKKYVWPQNYLLADKIKGRMDRYLDAQLKKLNTNRIDYYLLHGLNGVLWIH